MTVKLVMKELEKKVQAEAEKAELKFKLDLLEELKSKTPVDTGRARAGWRITSTGIENDVDYISELNAGSSEQAPAHFIEQTVLAHDGLISSGSIVTKL